MSLKEFSRQMQVSEATIHRWKSGDSSPEINNIEKMAEVLNVSPLEFFKTNVTEKKEDQSLEIIEQIASLGPSELEILRDTLKVLSKPLPSKAQKKKEA